MTASILALVAGAYQAWCIPQLLHAPRRPTRTASGPRAVDDEFPCFHRVADHRGGSDRRRSARADPRRRHGARRSPRPRFVIIGCVIAVVHTGVGWVPADNMLHWFAEIGADDYAFLWFNMPSRLASVLLSLVVPVITAILTLLPATRRWCRRIPTGALATETGAAQTDPARTDEND